MKRQFFFDFEPTSTMSNNTAGPRRGILRQSSYTTDASTEESKGASNERILTRANSERANTSRNVPHTRRLPKRTISFHEKNEEHIFTKLPNSSAHELFYDDDEIADMRYRALMEDAGLDPDADW